MKYFIIFISYFFFLSINFSTAQQKRTINWKGVETDAAANYVVAQLKNGITMVAIQEAFQNKDFYIEEMPDKLGIFKINVSSSQKPFIETIKQLSNLQLFEFVEPDIETHICTNPNDQYYNYQWGPPKVNGPFVWNITTGGSDILTAILDSGIPIQNNLMKQMKAMEL